MYQPKEYRRVRSFLNAVLIVNVVLIGTLSTAAVLLTPGHAIAQKLAPLPAAPTLNDKEVALGKLLFFDTRLSGDATISCATCHDPAQAFTDGLPMSQGYPGTLYFRNTPTIINAVNLEYFYWGGRLSGDDLAALIRDHFAEAHFMQADGRLVIERMRQVPEYEQQFRDTFGGEPSYGKILNSVAAFVRSTNSIQSPLDAHLNGDEQAIDAAAKRGLQLFTGKANCVQCHYGPMLNDQQFHNIGVEPNPDIFATPERHITFRRFFRTLGVGDYANLRFDLGCACVSKDDKQQAHFRTPSLREVSRTAPYMHNGTIASLKEVVEFYNRGGGTASGKDEALKPLGLSEQEISDLVAFLETLSGKPIECEPPTLPKYATRELGEN